MNTNVLQQLRARLAGWLGLRVALTLLALVGLAALAMFLGDAALALSDSARVLLPWALGLIALAVTGFGLWQWRKFDETRVARWFEHTDSSLGNRLTNAVQLSTKSGATDVEEFLRCEAVELGRRAADTLAAWPTVKRGVKLAAAAAGVALLLWVLFALIGNDVLRAVWPRFADPRGDHPPYSRLQIAVKPGATEIIYGGQLEVRASTSGRSAEKLWLVAQSSTNTTRALMFLAPDKSFFQSLANLREAADYFVTDGTARSKRFPIRIRYTPQITLVEVATEFPAYTGLAAQTNKLRDEPQALPVGTRVSFRVASNRPLRDGKLTLTPVLGGKPTEIALVTNAVESQVSGGFTLAEPVVFALSVRDVDGLACNETRQGRITLLPDERPRLFVLEPGRDAVATPKITVPVRVQAQDDYGITRVVWLRGFNRSLERPFAMPIKLQSGQRSVESSSAIEMAKLGVRPGDVIDYYFEAADNYPQGPNVTLSRPFRLQIISEEQYAQVLRQAAARKALFEPYFKQGAWLKRLAERARKLDEKARNATEAERAQLEKEAAELAKELADYQQALDKIGESASMFDVESAFKAALADQQERLSPLQKKLQQMSGGGQFDPKTMEEISKELTEMAGRQQEDVTTPAGQIASVARVMARADAFVKLAKRQAAIANLLRRYSDRSGALSRLEQMELQELAHQQQRVKEELHEMVTTLPELLAQVPEDQQFNPLRNDVNDFLEAIEQAKIEPVLADANLALTQQEAVAAFILAQQAADKMDALIAKCTSQKPGLMQQCLRFQPKIAQSMGNTMQQILDAMGVNQGTGDGGRDGYSLFNEAMALYGPGMELAGEQSGGRSDRGGAGARGSERVTGDTRDEGLPATETAARLRLQPDAKFPLRYRDVVGEYFRVIAEEGEKK